MMKLKDVVDVGAKVYFAAPENNNKFIKFDKTKHQDYLYRNVYRLDYSMSGVIVYLS